MNVIKIIAATGLSAALGLGTVLAPAAASASSASKPVVYSGSAGWSAPRHLPHKIVLQRESDQVVAYVRSIRWHFNNKGGAHINQNISFCRFRLFVVKLLCGTQGTALQQK